ncbi:hypothetical protein PROFUN_15121 [Planoprotostelium fungivorum]|uniref:ethanolamine kinase n=1 Tax=Planoprotostelium fungivorum TaxID=1890364 RepID=A0A2P6MZV1_9EUKA|nr:hypothetical protein PROFUN_15121 [Planoprotostelium fungivorum]
MNRRLKLTIDVTKDPERDALNIAKLAMEEWKDIADDDIHVRELAGGITNRLGFKDHHVLVRVYGSNTEVLIDRDEELRCITELGKISLAPPIHAVFNNGFVYGYYEGETLDATCTALANGVHNKEIAERMAEWHSSKGIEGDKRPTIWDKLLKYLSLVPDEYSTQEKNEQMKKANLSKARILEEIHFFKDRLEKDDLRVGFCHNDLLAGNVVYNPIDSEISFNCESLLINSENIYFIDYEYGAYNYNTFDIANHFCEWCGFELVYEQYPSKEKQYEFFKSYLKRLDGRDPSESELEKWYTDVQRMSLVCHFFWGIWALVQAHISQLTFDYLPYGINRIQYAIHNRPRLFE